MPEEHLSKLDTDINSARKIVSRVPLNGCTTDLQGLCLQSFILLSHAAIEAYFEDVGAFASRKALELYRQKKMITKTLIGLVSSKVLSDISEKARKKISGELASNIEEFASEALTIYTARLKSNHGIKKENIHNILVPLGVDPEIEDIFAYNELHSFGTHRGAIAHEFAAIRTEHTLSSVNTSLLTIRSGIETFDAAIKQALA